MATLQDRLVADMRTAMKAGEKARVGVLRMVIAGLKDEQLKIGRDDLDEGEELAILRRAVKTRRESVAQAEELGRSDVADQENSEIAILKEYLPAMMSPDELVEKVKELAVETGYEGPKDTGKFMKEWMSRYKGLAEGRDVQGALREIVK